jgi:universal stress protein E
MTEINTIFAVIDPSTDKQYALQRAIRIAKVCNARIHAYLCISSSLETHDPEALERVERTRYTLWLEKIVDEVKDEGIDINYEIDWNKDWRATLGLAASRANSDFIVKSSHRRSVSKSLLMTSSDQALLETAHCSVQLVSSDVVSDLHKVLIAVDTTRTDEKYQKIYNAVLEFGRTVASSNENGELHVVHAYSSSEDFQHVTDIARRVGVDTKYVHVNGNELEEAIADVAENINADVIVIGLSTRSTLAKRIFGNRVDKLLNNISRDILIVIPSEK